MSMAYTISFAVAGWRV